MPESPQSTRRDARPAEERGIVDQVAVPAAIAFSGGVGVGLGKAAGDAIVAKVTKAPDPPVDGKV